MFIFRAPSQKSHPPWLDFPVSTKNFAGPNYPDCFMERGWVHQLFLYLIVHSCHCTLLINNQLHESCYVHFPK